MCSRFDLILIILLTLSCYVFVSGKVKSKFKARHGPSGMSINDSTTCNEFSKFARFNPYSVLFEKWVVFFYWSPPRPLETYVFTFPTANHTKHLHYMLDEKTILPVDWAARHILMEDHRNETSLLVERGDRGEYWLYPLYKVRKAQKIRPRDVRLKQTGDNRILGFMDCDNQEVLAMARINDVPPKKHLQDEAARLGYRGRRGKSYLYQGHEWMPIPEDDEKHYWAPPPKKNIKDSSGEGKSSEQRNDEVEAPPTKEPEELDDEKTNHETTLHEDEIDKEMKERCIEIKPAYSHNPDDHEIPDELTITQKLGLTDNNKQKSIFDAEDIEKIIIVDSSLSNNEKQLGKEPESEHENNQIDNLQNNNERGMVQPPSKSKNFEPLLNEEAGTMKEPENSGATADCNDCYESEYLKSTNTVYIQGNSMSSKELDNTQKTCKSEGSVVSTERTAQSSNEPVGLNVSTQRNLQTSDATDSVKESTDRNPQNNIDSESSQTANYPPSPEGWNTPRNSSL